MQSAIKDKEDFYGQANKPPRILPIFSTFSARTLTAQPGGMPPGYGMAGISAFVSGRHSDDRLVCRPPDKKNDLSCTIPQIGKYDQANSHIRFGTN